MMGWKTSARASAQVLGFYYAATLLFVVLDYWFSVNVRLAFLETWPVARAIYYLLCFGCLALILGRPDWNAWIGTVESLTALSLLIVTMGVRVMTLSDQMLNNGSGLPTMSEILNFLIVGAAAWYSWMRGMASIRRGANLD